MPRSMNDSARIDALEIKIAHLERALSEISDVVIRQQRELDLAVARQQRLRDQLAMIESGEGPSATAEEKPPHY